MVSYIVDLSERTTEGTLVWVLEPSQVITNISNFSDWKEFVNIKAVAPGSPVTKLKPLVCLPCKQTSSGGRKDLNEMSGRSTSNLLSLTMIQFHDFGNCKSYRNSAAL